MRIFPANSTGWFWEILAHETSMLGHLYSVTYCKRSRKFVHTMRQAKPWFPYALDNGMFQAWTPATNSIDWAKWRQMRPAWKDALNRALSYSQKPIWIVVPDVPGNAQATLRRYRRYAPVLRAMGFRLALAVQDGMTIHDVLALQILPDVIAVGGSTDWKWATAKQWCEDWPEVHILRCNSIDKFEQARAWGAESCDGTGLNRGDRKQTKGVEDYCRKHGHHSNEPLWPHVCSGSPVKGTGQGELL